MSKEQSPVDTIQKEAPKIAPQEAIYKYEGEPLKVGVVGLVHTHVHWILGREKYGDIEIVGIVEPNLDLAQRYSEQHGYSMDIVYNTLEEMVEATQPEAVTAFNRIIDHLSVVEYCAPKGIHVMVEKPLAVSWEDAQKMIDLADKHSIHLLTNYETSWYGSNYAAYKMIYEEQKIGDIKKIIFYTGHPGPIEIGCNEEFVEWLIDPVLNGGGALTDFGCYGANLATWYMKGAQPQTVSCITQQFKPDKYPKVEDEATIILTYPKTQVIIQASWNWSHNRKDMEIYGKTGYIYCKNGQDMEVLEKEEDGPFTMTAEPLAKGIHDPFAYMTKVVKEDYPVEPFGLSSLDNNKVAMQILEAAKQSSETGEIVKWDDFFLTSSKALSSKSPTQKMEAFNMVFIKGGSFTMGCQKQYQADCEDIEKPAHRAKARDFWLNKYEVTNKEFVEFANAYHKEEEKEKGWLEWFVNYHYFKESSCKVDFENGFFSVVKKYEHHPVGNVSMYGIQKYLLWKSEEDGIKYRLPTEIEWEFAARGGNKSQHYNFSGSNNLDEVGWYRENSNGSTHRIGLKKPNELGLYDMSGNMDEWCSVICTNYIKPGQKDVDIHKDEEGESYYAYIHRGGAHNQSQKEVRITHRSGCYTSGFYYGIGFRLASDGF